MLFMVIERFKNRDAAPVYKRFREQGRMAPEGLKYIDSWVETNFDRCFQLMECENRELFQEWIANWKDLADFELVEVRTSQQARALFSET
jgi:hypothetical protein